MEFIAIPQRMSAPSGVCPLWEATRETRTTVSSAPPKALRGTAQMEAAPNPKAMALVAPSAPPVLMPMTTGLAIGFLKRPWSITPESASEAPTKAPVSVLGRRMCQMIVRSCAETPAPSGVRRPSSLRIMSRILMEEMSVMPTRTLSEATSKARAISPATRAYFFIGTIPAPDHRVRRRCIGIRSKNADRGSR